MIVTITVFIVLFLYLLYKLFIDKRLTMLNFFDIEKYIKILLKYGSVNDFIVIKSILKRKYFVQLVIYKKENLSCLALDFPNVGWSFPFYHILLDFIKENKYEYDIIKDKIDFIRIYFNADYDMAMELIRHIFYNIFKVKTTKYNIIINLDVSRDVLFSLPPLDDSQRIGYFIGLIIGRLLKK